jgi:hypothetical protein
MPARKTRKTGGWLREGDNSGEIDIVCTEVVRQLTAPFRHFSNGIITIITIISNSTHD